MHHRSDTYSSIKANGEDDEYNQHLNQSRDELASSLVPR